MGGLLTRDPSRVRVHSTQDPVVSPGEAAHPVVIMRPGLGALTTDFTTLAEDLASHGYVVVGFDGLLGRLDARRGLAITAAYVHRFFDTHLKAKANSLPSGSAPLYPEVEIWPR
jgi:alpha-beta hydrolase superfamily lysophospholipase